jgi:hypothetical protein
MARFDLDSYETVGERIAKAHDKYPDLRIISNLVETIRDEAGRPIQYVVQAQVWLGDILKGQDYAEEMVGSSNVNRTSALENCTTSAIGRALAAGLALQGVDPRKTRPSREEMEKVVRYETAAKITVDPEQEALAITAMSQVADISDMDELRNFYTGAKEAGILTIEMDGTSVNAMIARRKKELENN